MVGWKEKKISSQTKENATSLVILIKSSELKTKELEKITSTLLETLSTTLSIGTIEIESKDYRVTSSIVDGSQSSISIKVSF
jgi:hypothetical protein